MTDAEQTLWSALRNRQLLGFKFRRQATIGPFIVDFLCIEAGLVIEVDGGQHDAKTDQVRTMSLGSMGYRITRFWNSDVLSNLDGVLEEIASCLLHEKKTLTLPSPAKAGEG